MIGIKVISLGHTNGTDHAPDDVDQCHAQVRSSRDRGYWYCNRPVGHRGVHEAYWSSTKWIGWWRDGGAFHSSGHDWLTR